jgi:hypothetical protein
MICDGLCANCGLMHCSKKHLHSMTSSARASSEGGTVRPSVLAGGARGANGFGDSVGSVSLAGIPDTL